MEESEKKKTVRIKSRKTTRSEAKEHNLAVASSPQASFDYAILRASDIGCGRRVPSPSLFLHAMTIITSKPIKGIMLLTSYHHHHYHHRVIIVMVEDQETSKKRKTTITRRRGARAETCQGLEEEEQKTTWKYEHRPGRLVMASYPKAEPDKNGPHVRPPPSCPSGYQRPTFEREKTDPHNPIIQKRSLVPISSQDATGTHTGEHGTAKQCANRPFWRWFDSSPIVRSGSGRNG